jgi:tRNA pseudouridine55 synthase
LVANELDALARRLCGEQLQTPPMYSAIKRDGVPLYKLARRGQEVARTPRAVSIYALTLRAASSDTLAFEVHCSKGTYVRVLAQDIGAALATAAHLSALRRTAFGAFRLAGAVGIDDLKAGRRVGSVIDLRAALGHLREITIDATIAQRARNGQASALRALPAAATAELAKLIDPDGTLVAIVSADVSLRWRFERVFGVASPTLQSIAP